MLNLDGLTIEWLGQASVKIKSEKIIYIDPYHLKDPVEKADLILVTHSHYDHYSPQDIAKLTKSTTFVAIPEDAKKDLSSLINQNNLVTVVPNQTYKMGNLEILTIPSYNLNKPFHPLKNNWVGYIMSLNQKKIYHAGDTDCIPEMSKLKNITVALLPIGGTYTMDSLEAAKAVSIIKPEIAIPIHYGTIVGTKGDALKFKELCSSRVEIL